MDKAGENTARIMKEACEQEGITITYTATEAHQQNGEQERWFRMAFECVQAHQIATDALKNLWADGIMNFVYVYNRMVHGSSGKTPYELTFGKVPNVEDLRVLYCLAYARVLPKNRPDRKLGSHAIKGQYIGPAMYDSQPIGERDTRY